MKATLEKVRGGLDATVVIVHDDGDLPTCRYLLSEYEKYDLCGTIAMVANRIARLPSGEPNHEAIAAWQELLDSGRFSISSHSLTHEFWGLTDEEEGLIDYGGEDRPYRCGAGQITREVRDSAILLRAAFPSERVRAFVKPGFGRHKSGVQISEKAYEIIRRYYVTMRNTGGGVDTIPPGDPYNVHSYMVREGESADKWTSYVDEAIEKNGMIVYLFHGIKDSACGLTVAKAEASRLLDYIGMRRREGKIHVASFEDAVLYGEELRAARLTVSEDGNTLDLALESDLDPRLYDLPLTVRIEGEARMLSAEDGRPVVQKKGAQLVDLRLHEHLRLFRAPQCGRS